MIGRSLRAYGLFVALLLLWLGSVLGAFVFDNLLAWACGLLYVTYDTWLIGYVAWKTRGLNPTPPAATATQRPTLAVLIPARDEELVLAQTLDALLRQSDPPEEIVVINDGSTDHSAALLHQRYHLPETPGFAPSPANARLRVLHKPNTGKADSLNQALAHVSAEVVITLDADTRLQPDALQAMRAAFAREPQLAAACGVLQPRCKGHGLSARLFEWFQTFEYLRAFLARAAWMQNNALLLVSGAFAGYRREVLTAIGGYDSHSLVEDYELIHRLHRHAHDHQLNWRVRVIAEARADTDAPASLRAFLHQRRRWFAGFLQTQYRYRRMHGDARYAAVGRIMLPVKAADTLQPLYGISAFLLLGLFLASDAAFTWLVLAVMGIKLLIDFGYHLWAVRHYHRWLGQPLPRGIWTHAAAATLAEPFSFQLARHCGALWGWWLLLTGKQDWVPQRQWETRNEENNDRGAAA